MWRAFRSFLAFVSRTSHVGKYLAFVPREIRSGFQLIFVFFAVMPVAMATWLGALSVVPSRKVLADSDQAAL